MAQNLIISLNNNANEYLNTSIQIIPHNIIMYKVDYNTMYNIHENLDGGYYTFFDKSGNEREIRMVIETSPIIVVGTPVVTQKRITNIYWEYKVSDDKIIKIPYETLSLTNLTKVYLRSDNCTTEGHNHLVYYYDANNKRHYFDTKVTNNLAIPYWDKENNVPMQIPENASKICIIPRKLVNY